LVRSSSIVFIPVGSVQLDLASRNGGLGIIQLHE
jgi:hypothetical protein